jgi:tRNA pseudouridine38-40 synthase
LLLSYDGSAYHGFQLQENAGTVQGALEQALALLLGINVRVTPAGRTDTGVHAEAQVVNFHADTRIPVERLPFALNAVLPDDIVVRAAEIVPDTFHARISALSKTYAYTIDNAPHPRVLTRKYSYHFRFPLNVTDMATAASSLLGIHDFAAFRATGSTVRTTVRSLMRLDVAEHDSYVTITAEADGFLYHMVRIIAGTLLEVGSGRRAPDLTPLLAARERRGAGPTAPAHGLVLKVVRYCQ